MTLLDDRPAVVAPAKCTPPEFGSAVPIKNWASAPNPVLIEEDIERLARVEANKQQIYRSNSCCSPSRGMLLEVSGSPTTTGGIVFAAIAWLLLFAAIAWPFLLAVSAI